MKPTQSYSSYYTAMEFKTFYNLVANEQEFEKKANGISSLTTGKGICSHFPHFAIKI